MGGLIKQREYQRKKGPRVKVLRPVKNWSILIFACVLHGTLEPRPSDALVVGLPGFRQGQHCFQGDPRAQVLH